MLWLSGLCYDLEPIENLYINNYRTPNKQLQKIYKNTSIEHLYKSIENLRNHIENL